MFFLVFYFGGLVNSGNFLWHYDGAFALNKKAQIYIEINKIVCLDVLCNVHGTRNYATQSWKTLGSTLLCTENAPKSFVFRKNPKQLTRTEINFSQKIDENRSQRKLRYSCSLKIIISTKLVFCKNLLKFFLFTDFFLFFLTNHLATFSFLLLRVMFTHYLF